MSDIIIDPESTDEERTVAFDAMTEALFPGMAVDILESYRERMKSPEAAAAAAELKTDEKHFVDRLRSLMNTKGITQEQLAAAANISQPAVSNILARRCRPQKRTVERFAGILGVDPTQLWPQYNWEPSQG